MDATEDETENSILLKRVSVDPAPSAFTVWT